MPDRQFDAAFHVDRPHDSVFCFERSGDDEGKQNGLSSAWKAANEAVSGFNWHDYGLSAL